MPLLEKTLYVFPLRMGAIAVFTYALLVNLQPLYNVSRFITRTLRTAILNMCQALFAIFSGVVAIVGGIYKIPELVLLFVTYYLGMLLVDFTSVIGTIALSNEFDGHDLLTTTLAVSKKPSPESVWIYFAFVKAFTVLFRMYLIAIVYSFYEELKNPPARASEEGSIEESSSAAVASNSPKNSPKNNRT